MVQLTLDGDNVLMPVKVVPKSSRDRIVGELDGALKVAISAAPEKGEANKAVCKLIAKTLGLRTNQVQVDTGHGSPRKILRIKETSIERVRDALTET